MLQAASEVTLRGLAKITLLGHPGTVHAEASKLGIDISLCDVVDPVVRTKSWDMSWTARGQRLDLTPCLK